MFFSFLLTLFLVVLCESEKDSLISLNEDNFSDLTRNSQVSALFVESRAQLKKDFEEIDRLWKSISKFCISDERCGTKISIVECNSSPQLCDDQDITEPLVVKLFADNPSDQLKTMQKFFESKIQISLDRIETERKLNSGKCLTKFFIPDCKFCKILAPVWSDLERNYAKNKDFTFVSINCDEQMKICNIYNREERFPAIYWIANGVSKEKFTGDKSFDALQSFINKMESSRVKRSIDNKIEQAKSGVYELTSSNFYDFISSDCSFVKFYIPGCKYCQKVNALWDPLALNLVDHTNIKIGRVDCIQFPGFCLQEAIGCPTLSVFKNGKRIRKDYQLDLTIEGLTDCIISNCAGGKIKSDWKQREKVKRQLMEMDESD